MDKLQRALLELGHAVEHELREKVRTLEAHNKVLTGGLLRIQNSREYYAIKDQDLATLTLAEAKALTEKLEKRAKEDKPTFLESLGEAAEKATDGPWNTFANRLYFEHNQNLMISGDRKTPCWIIEDADAHFIALANPQTVRWLLKRINRLCGHARHGPACFGEKCICGLKNDLQILDEGPTPQPKEK